MGLWEKLGLVTVCDSCGETQGLMKCPHCDKPVCESCLEGLVMRQKWPQWFVGRQVTDFEGFEKTINIYIDKVHEQQGTIHVCKPFLKFRWGAVERHFDDMNRRFGKIKPYEFK